MVGVNLEFVFLVDIPPAPENDFQENSTFPLDPLLYTAYYTHMARPRGPGPRRVQTSSGGGGGTGRYPWDEWFQRAQSGDVVLRRGVDYECRSDTFRQQIRNRARLNVRVETRIRDDGETVTFRVKG
jgi:hypothetical protein